VIRKGHRSQSPSIEKKELKGLSRREGYMNLGSGENLVSGGVQSGGGKTVHCLLSTKKTREEERLTPGEKLKLRKRPATGGSSRGVKTAPERPRNAKEVKIAREAKAERLGGEGEQEDSLASHDGLKG